MLQKPETYSSYWGGGEFTEKKNKTSVGIRDYQHTQIWHLMNAGSLSICEVKAKL